MFVSLFEFVSVCLFHLPCNVRPVSALVGRPDGVSVHRTPSPLRCVRPHFRVSAEACAVGSAQVTRFLPRRKRVSVGVAEAIGIVRAPADVRNVGSVGESTPTKTKKK